jgi:ubiquinone/menaquinone biosynthesis C-methylase UbiE
MRRPSIYLESWYAKGYDADRFGGSFGRYLQHQEVETVLAMINGVHGRAGTGKLSIPLIQLSIPVVSVDFSSEMLAQAWKKAKNEAVTLKSVTCDAQQLCFRDAAFECVVSSRMLMHLSDWRQGIAELCRVAKNIVVFDFPPVQSCASLDSLWKRFKRRFDPDARPYKTFAIQSVLWELQRNNFRAVEIRKQFFLPVAFHRWMNRPLWSRKIEWLLSKLFLIQLFGAPVTVKAVRKERRSVNYQHSISEGK